MTTIDFMSSLPAEVTEGGAATAEGGAHAFRSIEGLFQSGVHDKNVDFRAIRGQSFRKSGLTEVFRRVSRGDFWIGGDGRNVAAAALGSPLASRGGEIFDIPGSALRFRLRAPAEVLVFFTARLQRFNRPDVVYETWVDSGDTRVYDDWVSTKGHRHQPRGGFYAKISAWWEGGSSEPGEEYLQAESILKGWGALVEERDAATLMGGRHYADMSRGIFLPWSIRSREPLSETRAVHGPTSTDGLTGSNIGRLRAGWHNIRHTMQFFNDLSVTQADIDGDTDFKAHQSPFNSAVFSTTELVVLANYGPGDHALAISGIDDKNARIVEGVNIPFPGIGGIGLPDL